ncbi:MAG: hypothetical protein Q9227_000595 [Pyrenula ochraceoflavens]
MLLHHPPRITSNALPPLIPHAPKQSGPQPSRVQLPSPPILGTEPTPQPIPPLLGLGLAKRVLEALNPGVTVAAYIENHLGGRVGKDEFPSETGTRGVSHGCTVTKQGVEFGGRDGW